MLIDHLSVRETLAIALRSVPLLMHEQAHGHDLDNESAVIGMGPDSSD